MNRTGTGMENDCNAVYLNSRKCHPGRVFAQDTPNSNSESREKNHPIMTEAPKKLPAPSSLVVSTPTVRRSERIRTNKSESRSVKPETSTTTSDLEEIDEEEQCAAGVKGFHKTKNNRYGHRKGKISKEPVRLTTSIPVTSGLGHVDLANELEDLDFSSNFEQFEAGAGLPSDGDQQSCNSNNNNNDDSQLFMATLLEGQHQQQASSLSTNYAIPSTSQSNQSSTNRKAFISSVSDSFNQLLPLLRNNPSLQQRLEEEQIITPDLVERLAMRQEQLQDLAQVVCSSIELNKIREKEFLRFEHRNRYLEEENKANALTITEQAQLIEALKIQIEADSKTNEQIMHQKIKDGIGDHDKKLEETQRKLKSTKAKLNGVNKKLTAVSELISRHLSSHDSLVRGREELMSSLKKIGLTFQTKVSDLDMDLDDTGKLSDFDEVGDDLSYGSVPVPVVPSVEGRRVAQQEYFTISYNDVHGLACCTPIPVTNPLILKSKAPAAATTPAFQKQRVTHASAAATAATSNSCQSQITKEPAPLSPISKQESDEDEPGSRKAANATPVKSKDKTPQKGPAAAVELTSTPKCPKKINDVQKKAKASTPNLNSCVKTKTPEVQSAPQLSSPEPEEQELASPTFSVISNVDDKPEPIPADKTEPKKLKSKSPRSKCTLSESSESESDNEETTISFKQVEVPKESTEVKQASSMTTKPAEISASSKITEMNLGYLGLALSESESEDDEGPATAVSTTEPSLQDIQESSAIPPPISPIPSIQRERERSLNLSDDSDSESEVPVRSVSAFENNVDSLNLNNSSSVVLQPQPVTALVPKAKDFMPDLSVGDDEELIEQELRLVSANANSVSQEEILDPDYGNYGLQLPHMPSISEEEMAADTPSPCIRIISAKNQIPPKSKVREDRKVKVVPQPELKRKKKSRFGGEIDLDFLSILGRMTKQELLEEARIFEAEFQRKKLLQQKSNLTTIQETAVAKHPLEAETVKEKSQVRKTSELVGWGQVSTAGQFAKKRSNNSVPPTEVELIAMKKKRNANPRIPPPPQPKKGAQNGRNNSSSSPAEVAFKQKRGRPKKTTAKSE